MKNEIPLPVATSNALEGAQRTLEQAGATVERLRALIDAGDRARASLEASEAGATLDALEQFAAGEDDAQNRAVQIAQNAIRAADIARQRLPEAHRAVAEASTAVQREARLASIAAAFWREGNQIADRYLAKVAELTDVIAEIKGFERVLLSVGPERHITPGALNLNLPQFLLSGLMGDAATALKRSDYDWAKVQVAADLWGARLKQISDGVPA